MKNIIDISVANYKKTAFITGAMSALAFPPVYALFLFFIATVISLKIADKLSTYKKVCTYGYLFGFAHFVTGLYWIANALLVDFVRFAWLYPITLISIGAFFGLFIIPPFAMWHYFKRKNIWIKIVAFACMWVISEWIRSFIFTGFPWNMLGTTLAFDEIFIQTASIWGTYGLSFIVLILTGSFYAICNKKYKSGIVIFATLFLFLSIYGYWRINKYENITSDIKVRLVQPSIPQSMKWNKTQLEKNFYEYVNLSKSANVEDIDFVIWGETALSFDIEYDNKYKSAIKEAIPNKGYLITGLVRFDDYYRPYNSMYVYDKDANVVNFYDKNHLVPFGEYIPLRKYLPKWVRPIANNIAEFATSEKFKNIQIDKYPPFGALICYEIIFPDNVVNRKNKPNWLVVLTNDGWYGKSSGPYQHLVSAQMRAVEEGISVVRSANSGISAVINPLGHIVNKIDLHNKGYIDVVLPENLEIGTIYSTVGNVGIVGFMLLCIAFLFTVSKSQKMFKK